MNSYERVMTTLKLKEPDRVPIAEFVIDKKVYNALMPEAKEQSDFEEAYDFDVMGARAFYKTTWESGDAFADEWGVVYRRNEEVVPHPVKGPIETYEDLKNYVVPGYIPERLDRLPELVKKYKGEKAIVFHQRAGFLWAANLVGLDNLLMYFLAEPEFVHELLDKILAEQIILARNAIRAGADAIIETDDYAFNNGPLFSPQVFRDFLYPRLKKFVEAVHEEGGMVIKHSDGNLMKILDQIVDTGVDGIHSIDPLAGMDIGIVKNRYGKRISLWGNIDCSNLLTFGSTADVEMAVKKCIADAAPGGGFVLISSNSIQSSVKPENYEAMIKAGKLYGSYPIEL